MGDNQGVLSWSLKDHEMRCSQALSVCVCTLALHGCLQDSRLRGNHVFKVFPLPAHLFLTPCQEGMSWSESHCFSL